MVINSSKSSHPRNLSFHELLPEPFDSNDAVAQPLLLSESIENLFRLQIIKEGITIHCDQLMNVTRIYRKRDSDGVVSRRAEYKK